MSFVFYTFTIQEQIKNIFLKNLFKNPDNHIAIKYHIVFWISYFFFNFIRWGIFYEDFYHSFKSNILEFVLHILITYFTIYYLVPKYILSKKYLTFIIWFVVSLIVVYILRTEFSLKLLYQSSPEFDRKIFKSSYKFIHILSTIVGEIYVIAFTSALKFTVDWIFEKNKYDNLKRSQLKLELELLKTQIQPHFFFNTLNNLYALTLEKSKKAPEVVLKLSEIMEYVLYSAKKPKIRLIQEIEYIQSYIDLEKLRYGEAINVTVNVQGNIENHFIPPLLFLPFMENCFKHGILDNNNNLNVEIDFEMSETNYLKFSAKNNYNPFIKEQKNHGVDNENVVRRLKLLFEDSFTLETKKEEENYIVNLGIQL